jgi:hypothetical protein
MTMFNDLFLSKPILGLWIQLQRSDLFLDERQERDLSHSVVTYFCVNTIIINKQVVPIGIQ